MSEDDPLDNNGVFEIRITPKIGNQENQKMSKDKVENSFRASQKWPDKIWSLLPDPIKLAIILGVCSLTGASIMGFSGQDALHLFNSDDERPKTPTAMMERIDKKLGDISTAQQVTDKKLIKVIQNQKVADEKMDNMKDDIAENRDDIKDLLKK